MLDTLLTCPVCDGSNFSPYKEVKDHLLSHETFKLLQCNHCKLVVTSPYPSGSDMLKYYESSNYISHSADEFKIKDLPYSIARKYMLRQKRRWIEEYVDHPGTLLDYGCGVGTFLTHMQSNQWQVWGIEPNRKAREFANTLVHNRVYNHLDELPEKKFQVITLWHVLEHIESINSVLQSLNYLLAKQGILMVAVPNYASYDAHYYQEHWAAYDVPRHLFHFTPETMLELAKKHRLHLVKTIPLKLDAIYISLLSEKYRNGHAINGIFQGIKSNLLAKENRGNYSSLAYVLKR